MGDIIKLPVLGIQNAGKTSLITTLQREFTELSSLAPTKKIERTKLNFFDKKLIVWDFGGQEKYRSKYSKKASNYFTEIGGEAFYVVDIQDFEKFNDSLTYFEEIIDAIKKYSPDTTINFLIHKIDPGMENNQDIVEKFNQLKETFSDKVKPLKIRINQTSIYNPLSVIRAFSRPIFGNSTLYDNFTMIFKEFVEETKCDFALIFSDELLEIGNYFAPDISQNKMKEIADEIFASYHESGFDLSKLGNNLKDLSIQIVDFKPKDKKYFFTYGFNPDKSDSSSINMKAMNVLNDVKKLMMFL